MAKRDGFHTLTPYLICDDANAAAAFYCRVFEATEISMQRDDRGVLRHGELRIGDSPVMLCSAVPEYPFMRSASSTGGSPMQVFVYCDDADRWFNSAVAAGARVVMEMADKTYGRTGGVEDPFGFTWWLTTHRD
jgi:uncharacterized glyoxalase superfamily protein PhnB